MNRSTGFYIGAKFFNLFFRSSKIKNSVRNFMRIGKQRSWGGTEKEELLQNAQPEPTHLPATSNMTSACVMQSSDNESIISADEIFYNQKK